ncbi:cysteinyl-tRNA synthetase, partial [Tulasnella sp. 403]
MTDPTQPAPAPKRTLFSSSKASTSKTLSTSSPNQSGHGLTRVRGGSEASTSYVLATSAVNSTPLYAGTEVEDTWQLLSSNTTTLLPHEGSYDAQGAAGVYSDDKLEVKDGKRGLMDKTRALGLQLKRASKIGLARIEGSDDTSTRHGQRHYRSLSGGPSHSLTSSTKRWSQPPAPLALGGLLSKGTRAYTIGPGLLEFGHRDSTWQAPESWGMDQAGPGAADYSSDEELREKVADGSPANGIGVVGHGRSRNSYMGLPGPRNGTRPNAATEAEKGSWSDYDHPMNPRPSDAPISATTTPKARLFQIRVYRTDGTYHIVECPVNTIAQDLSHVLRKKLLLPGQQFKLHLRERGRERVLGPQERPINILRRRLEQAGYDESDNLEHLGGDDLGFLLQFVFRDANLTSAQASGEDDVLSSSSSLENIDLTGRGLLTIPIALHRHTSTIVILNLSKNPHIDIPLDFIAACTTLRDLRLSHAAMKQVPSRVKHISTLHELDISCNRMVSLDEADLHKIPNLRNVQAQNNRLATLPSWFPEMKGLKFLNISNNKFDVIPPVLCQLSNLLELDLSFNTISVFPAELGALVNLQRLVIVGNRIGSIPPEVANMASLKELDCRRNALTDLSTVFKCTSLEVLRAENNLLHGVALPAGSKIRVLCVSGNERLSSFQVETRGEGAPPYVLETLDLSKCMLSSLNDASLDQLGRLQSLIFDHNTIRVIPDAVCSLQRLKYLSGSNNHLDALPAEIGCLTELESLHVHSNNVKVIPASIWQCGSLTDFNASSNLIESWLDPVEELSPIGRKTSRGDGSTHNRHVAPLATCLENLYLADNRLEDDIFHSLSILRSLKVLNLAFNDIYELPPLRLQIFAQLRELYLSGNRLTSLPGEDLHRLCYLRILFLNANKLQTLPSELTKVKTLEVLDVGNNVLKYNVSNWQFDWNWNFNRELRYLNLSGNKRLEIKNAISGHNTARAGRAPLTDFLELTHLKMLGLMDVTLSVNPSIPDETEERRVRTSPSDINRMAYGIADTLGIFDNVDKPNSLKLSMFDLVVPSFR